jgi:hypothetical protein
LPVIAGAQQAEKMPYRHARFVADAHGLARLPACSLAMLPLRPCASHGRAGWPTARA